MRVAVLYATLTGHSRKIAIAIAKELKVRLYDAATVPNIQRYDLVFIVSGIYDGKSSPELIHYAKSFSPEQAHKVVFITSSMTLSEPLDVKEILIRNEMNVQSRCFTCKGRYKNTGITHPNRADINSAVSFAKSFVKQL